MSTSLSAEVSTQSAERALKEQLGLDISQVGGLELCISALTLQRACLRLLLRVQRWLL